MICTYTQTKRTRSIILNYLVYHYSYLYLNKKDKSKFVQGFKNDH